MNEKIEDISTSAPLDTWAALDLWLRRWHWIALWTLVLAVAGAVAAHYYWGTTYTASAQLIHYAPSAADDSYHPREIGAPSLVVMLQSGSLFDTVGSELKPPLSATKLGHRLQLTLDRNNDIAEVTAEGRDRDETVDLANRFTTEAIAYTQSLQRQEAAAAAESVRQQTRQVDAEITSALSEVPPASAAMVAEIAGSKHLSPEDASEPARRLKAAQDRLDELVVVYTDAHPLVREQRARVAELEESLKQSSSTAADAGPTRSEQAGAPASFVDHATPEEIAMGERLRTLESGREILGMRQHAIQPFVEQPPGYFSVLVPATAGRALRHAHLIDIILWGLLGAFFGFIFSCAGIVLAELMDNRVKTRIDVLRVTGLPLLATLGDLKRISAAEADQWGFRTWTALQRRLDKVPGRGVVCGFTSAHASEGRSTLVGLLSQGALACGNRVLKISARSSTGPARREMSPSTPGAPLSPDENASLERDILNAPARIAERLMGAEAPSAVEVALPDGAWSPERRRQWQAALEAWRSVENVVVLVELPPASVSETILLAGSLPNVVWVADSSRADAAETRTDLETLRDAGCNLVGAVLNRERSAPARSRFGRWQVGALALSVLALALAAAPAANADGPADGQSATVAPGTAPSPESPATFSVVAPAQRGTWQQRLTLGPGDILNLHIYNSPELTREDVPIGPDGRISYLEAQNVMAAGLTVDELRARLNDELSSYRRAPQAFVVPVSYPSKRYSVLGSVALQGSYPLDSPTTVVEAVARAKGFENGLSGGDVVPNIDLSRSFVGRAGKRLPVDLEALFLHGDLSQNVALEPGDYLYFSAAAGGQVFVLGEVRTPGAAPCDADSSVLSVIAARGGFSQRAWMRRVLVIRGSLDRPKAFRVDVASALTDGTGNLALEPGDLVYVANRPWVRVEELLDTAASAFVEGAVITWTGLHVSAKGAPISP